MSYNLTVSGHKDEASAEDVAALKIASDQFADSAVELGFSVTGSLQIGEDVVTLSRQP